MLEMGRNFLVDRSIDERMNLREGSSHRGLVSTLFFQRDFLCYTLVLVHFFLFFKVFVFHRGFLILRKK